MHTGCRRYRGESWESQGVAGGRSSNYVPAMRMSCNVLRRGGRSGERISVDGGRPGQRLDDAGLPPTFLCLCASPPVRAVDRKMAAACRHEMMTSWELKYTLVRITCAPCRSRFSGIATTTSLTIPGTRISTPLNRAPLTPGPECKLPCRYPHYRDALSLGTLPQSPSQAFRDVTKP